MELQLETRKIIEGINRLHSSVSSQEWADAGQTVFVASLEKTLNELESLQERFKKVEQELNKGEIVGAPQLGGLFGEFDAALPVLKNNLKMEREKKSRVKELNIHEKEENAELFAELAQRIQTLLLRARYSAERLNVFAFRQSSVPLEGKSTARQVLDLLQTKEQEIEELKGKYEDVRKRSYLGHVQEHTSVDLEQELGQLSMKMAAMANGLSKEISIHKSQIEYIQNSYSEVKERLKEIKGVFDGYVDKSMELIMLLKKERDYAKKIVLDVEHETLQLRNTYTNEMLALQENKLRAKKEAEKKFVKEMESLKTRLKENDASLKSFRKIAEDKAAKENALEEKIEHLTLLLKTKEKHEKAKAALKKREKR